MTRMLLTAHPLLLLLLLLQSLKPLQFFREESNFYLPPDVEEEFEDYVEEVLGTGATRPPTKEKFIRFTIIQPGRPLLDNYYCTDTIKDRNVHHRFKCVKEHYFLLTPYDELKQSCRHRYVQCKNGVRKCNMSKNLVEGLYCKLIAGTQMPECTFESTYKRGYAFITCQWEDRIQELVPDNVDDISMPTENEIESDDYILPEPIDPSEDDLGWSVSPSPL
ncbi:inactive ribonuclease-like protein 9 [Tupaia chinensis]|nr:inactive ribonuclease-like protein 9 [Tupaia chinensis]XP_006163142.1 inactive ribonuclease-like protein 9 [Tupaia chinensis]XP_006163143.1 inactive ribonuclease-like protein 9 [Tupaia chinensis]